MRRFYTENDVIVVGRAMTNTLI